MEIMEKSIYEDERGIEKEKGYNIQRYFVLFVITTVGFMAIGLLYNLPNKSAFGAFGILIKGLLWFLILFLLTYTDNISDFIRGVKTFVSTDEYKRPWWWISKLARRSDSTSTITFIIALVFTLWVLTSMPKSLDGNIKMIELLKDSAITGIIATFLMEILTSNTVYIYKTPARQPQN